jgi:hypothetical protein
MFIPDPDLYPSRIPDPKTAKKEMGQKKIFSYFFVVTNLTKIEYYFIFEMPKKKIWANFKELLKFLPKKFSLCSQIYGFGIQDPRSGKNLFRIQGSKRHWIPDPDPQHCC